MEKRWAARIRGELKLETARLAAEGITPGLAVVLVGDDPASQIYVRSKTSACAEAGIKTFDHRLPAATSDGELLGLVASLNTDPGVDGILIQLPLPAGIDARRVLFAVDPRKDVDGIHPGERRPPADGRAAVRRLHAVRRDEADRGGAAAAGRRATPWSSVDRTWSASRWRRCCSTRTRP